MQVTLRIEDIDGEGFFVDCREHLTYFCASNHNIMAAMKDYKSNIFPKGTAFKYRSLFKSRRVTRLIKKQLKQDAVESNKGLQRLSAEVILKNPFLYPPSMLSDPTRVPKILKETIIDETAKNLRSAGII